MTHQTLTDEQTAILASPDEPTARVAAYAGTGKTYTLSRYAMSRPQERFLYLAFNKSVRLEAERKFPSNANCSTFHALAYAGLGIRGPVLGYVSYFSVAKLLGIKPMEAVDVVDLVEAFQRSADPDLTIRHYPGNVDDVRDVDHLLDRARRVWRALQSGDLPMTHNTYLKLFQLRKPRLPGSAILLDEAQDANPVMLDLLQHQVHAGHSRLIAVGDSFQRIYAFNGAVDAMDRIQGTQYRLTLSWRFGEELADKSTEFLRHFYPLEHPVRGQASLSTVALDADARPAAYATFEYPYTFLSRGNTALFREALQQAQLGRRIALTGGDTFRAFMAELLDLRLAHQGRAHECKNILAKVLGSWDRLRAWATSRGDNQLATKMDIVESYGASLPRAIQSIEAAAGPDDEAQVLLTTAHRAKGREWARVTMANDFSYVTDLRGKPLKPTDDAVQDVKVFTHIPASEVNLLYVAMTRATEAVVVAPAVTNLFRREPNPYLVRLAEENNLVLPEEAEAAQAAYSEAEDEEDEAAL